MIDVVGEIKYESVKYLPSWVLLVVNGTFCHFRDSDYRILCEYFTKYNTAAMKALKKKAL